MNLNDLIYILPAVAIALSIHEFSHALVAYKLGDQSQKGNGRLTLNPMKHLDPMGTLSLIIFGFGWAKPVQVETYFFKDKKQDMVWTSFAGPMSNLIFSFLCIVVWGAMFKFSLGNLNGVGLYFIRFLSVCASVNVGLGLFNLIPIPPLDGSKILMGILPENTYEKLMSYERYLSILLIICLFSGVLNGPLIHAKSAMIDLFLNISRTIWGI